MSIWLDLIGGLYFKLKAELVTFSCELYSPAFPMALDVSKALILAVVLLKALVTYYLPPLLTAVLFP